MELRHDNDFSDGSTSLFAWQAPRLIAKALLSNRGYSRACRTMSKLLSCSFQTMCPWKRSCVLRVKSPAFEDATNVCESKDLSETDGTVWPRRSGKRSHCRLSTIGSVSITDPPRASAHTCFAVRASDLCFRQLCDVIAKRVRAGSPGMLTQLSSNAPP